MSSSQSQHRSPEPQEKFKPHKIFITNLEVEVPIPKIQQELWQKFSKYGKLDTVVAKKSYNNEYSFAFIEFKEGEDASQAVNQLNNTNLLGKKMKVELQDNARRRKGGNETCYVCGKPGHYARNCRQNKQNQQKERRRSVSEPKHRKKSKKHRRRSSSSESSQPRKKDKKRSKKVKKHSKHKRSSKRSNSNSSD